jgi:uncharacterized membrane protein YfcA
MENAVAAALAPFLSLDYAAMALIVAAGACLQGAGGIGFGMFVAPLVAILHPELVPGPVLVLAAILALMSMLREFGAMDFAVLGYSLAGRIPASIAGGMTVAMLPVRALSIVFALLILAAVAMSLRGWRVAPAPRNLVVAGAVSGFMGTITSVGAPPMAIVCQGLPAATLRATIGGFVLVGALFSVAALAWFGRFGGLELSYGAALLLPLAAGFAVSSRLVARIRREQMRLLILALSSIAAVALLLLQFV